MEIKIMNRRTRALKSIYFSSSIYFKQKTDKYIVTLSNEAMLKENIIEVESFNHWLVMKYVVGVTSLL